MSAMDYEINKELGECYLFMNDFTKAEEYYQKATEAEPTQVAPVMGLATIAMQRGETENALTLYSKALSLEENDKVLAGMGLVKMQMGVHEEAFEYFVRSLNLNPQNAVSMNCLVHEGYQLSRLEEVVPHLEIALQNDSHNEDIHISLAGCLVSLGRVEEGTKHLESVLAENPANTSAKELYDHLTMAA